MKDAEKLSIRPTPGGAVVAVKAVPGSSRSRVVGVLGESLKIAVSAPPEKGKANAAVVEVLADLLGVDNRRVRLVSGPGSPRKEFLIAGMQVESLRRLLSKS